MRMMRMKLEEADMVLKRLTELGFLQTRVNQKTMEKEIAITNMGELTYNVLKKFAEQKD